MYKNGMTEPVMAEIDTTAARLASETDDEQALPNFLKRQTWECSLLFLEISIGKGYTATSC